MSKPITHSSEVILSTEWLDSYLQDNKSNQNNDGTNTVNKNSTTQYTYQLPLGRLIALKTKIYLASDNPAAIQSACQAAIKFGLRWKSHNVKNSSKSDTESHADNQTESHAENHAKNHTKNDVKSADESYIKPSTENLQEKSATFYIMILDIKSTKNAKNFSSNNSNTSQSITPSFGAQYFIDNLAIDADITGTSLQLFSWQDWQLLLSELQTPNELWQLLHYHSQLLQQAALTGQSNFDSQSDLLAQFMSRPELFATAIDIDNSLVNYGIQEQPNTTLVAMSLAQKNHSVTMTMYHEQMRQAAKLWSQLSVQMLQMNNSSVNSDVNSSDDLPSNSSSDQQSQAKLLAMQHNLWQQQLLEESLFSRYELVSTLYKHPKRPIEMQQSGYVIHQHSYESLGRHYVMIFYGQGKHSKQSRETIAPNLEQIAQDIAMRLPIAELHHVVVLGIDFMVDEADTYVDIDLFIQPIIAMSQKERQLTRQLQKLSQKDKQHSNKHMAKTTGTSELPKIQLNLTIPARKINI